MPALHLPTESRRATPVEQDSTSETHSARMTTDSLSVGRSGWENSTTVTARVFSFSISSNSAKRNSSIPELQPFRLWLTVAEISAGRYCRNSRSTANRQWIRLDGRFLGTSFTIQGQHDSRRTAPESETRFRET